MNERILTLKDSADGIDVCLSCFQSGCLASGREHALAHYQANKNHPLALNIKRKEKPKPQDVSSTRFVVVPV